MRKAYALFDFDGTIIAGDSILMFCRYAYRRGLCTRAQLRYGLRAAMRYVLGLSTAAQSKMAALSFLRGQSHAQLSALSADFCREVIEPRLRQEALAALESHRQSGAEILLITASPSFYLEPLKGTLGITEIIGTRMDIDADGIATGLICGENCKHLQKPLRLAEYLAATGNRLDYDTSYAYGDSLSDLPMLELCAHKVAVNPRRKLRKKLRNVDGAAIARWRR